MTRALPFNVIYDTDIGSDVDDALTLSMLLGSPEVNLAGVTTVYGDTLLRARIGRRLMGLAHADPSIPVVPGAATTLTGRPIWWPGHEGSTMDDLDTEHTNSLDVTDFIAQQARLVDDLVVICTGPLTDLALTVTKHPDFARNVAGLTIMGGAFGPTRDGKPEHNFACDPEAAKIVIDSGIPLTIVGLEITRQIKVSQPDVDRITESGPLGVALGREIEQWWKFNGEQWNVPHDPVAALTLIRPDLFTFQPATVDITVEHTPGASTAAPNPDSRTRIVTSLNAEAVAHTMVERIVRASQLQGRPR